MKNPPATPPLSTFPAHFHVAVDIVALTIKRGLLQVAVVQRRGNESCISEDGGPVRLVPRTEYDFALPGGRVNWESESLKEAAQRELFEETNIEVSLDDLEQIGAYGDPGRDPRPGRTISVAFVAFHPEFSSPFAGSDAAKATFMDVIDLLAEPNRLEFDHRTILRDAITKVRYLMERTPIALKFCPEEFTLLELRDVYNVLFHPAYSPDRSDAKIQLDAEKLRRFDANEPSRPVDLAINLFAQNFSLLSKPDKPPPIAASIHLLRFPHEPLPIAALIHLESLTSPEMLQASRSGGRRSQRSRSEVSRPQSPDSVVLHKIQKLLTDEYRKPTSGRPEFKINLDAANFLRKARAIEGFLEAIDGRTQLAPSGKGKPAQVYRRGRSKRLDPPLIVDRKPSKKT